MSAAAPSEDDPQPRRRLRILVVDDEKDAVLMLTTILRDEGHEVVGLYRGDEVMDVAREFHPDAVLLDIGMPDLSGYEVARKLRSRYGDERPFLVAVTGWTQASDKMLAHIVGFNHHLPKPCDPNALLEVLELLK